MLTKVSSEKHSFPISKSIGVIGGGQLSRMIGQSAQSKGVKFFILAETREDCALDITPFVTLANLKDFKAVTEFIKKCDRVTFESEFFPAEEFLQYLEQNKLSLLKQRFFPSLEHLSLFQKRNSQKQWLLENQIPTANLLTLAQSQINFLDSELKPKSEDLAEALRRSKQGYVLKKNFGGYDGYGTFFYPEITKSLTPEKFLNLLEQDLIIESKVEFKREMAVSIVCSQEQMVFLPLVETFQKEGRCDWVRGPVKHPAWPSLQRQLKKALRKLGYLGLITFELFDTGKELLVNEVAPRVHNSGHYSLDALEISQFEYHWRAGFNLPLWEPRILSKSFVMTNLVGTSADSPIIPENIKGSLHWYGKTPNRSRRKMGHINYLGQGPKLLNQALKERKRIHL